jgi:serine/threonine protein phosphatase PrpC
VVIWAGTWRVNGVLAVSRAFGDRPLKRYVIALPDVHHMAVDTTEETIILASDGLWDVVDNQVCFRQRCKVPQECSAFAHASIARAAGCPQLDPTAASATMLLRPRRK